MSKMTFKRISLAVVAALGFGVLSVAPSSAAIDETLTLSAASATVNIGDTATVTITNSFTSEVANESRTVFVSGAGGQGGTVLAKQTTDSANTSMATTREITVTTDPSSPTFAESVTATNLGAVTKQTITLKFYAVTTAGTYTFTITSRDKVGTLAVYKSASFTLTVSAANTVASAATSKLWIQESPTAGTVLVSADSTLVVAANKADTPIASGYIVADHRNSSDTTVAVASAGTLVDAPITLVISGPGTLSKGLHSAVTSRTKSVTLSRGETATIWSDGTAGTATITGSIYGTNLTQAAKTIKFFGAPTTITATLETAVVYRADTANGVVTFTAADAASNAVTTAAYNTATGSTGKGFWAISSDTKVAGSTAYVTTAAFATPCSYVATRAKWVCNIGAIDSGTATITIADSNTVTGAAITSAAVTMTVAGAAYTGTVSVAKASAPSVAATTFAPGEKVIFTATAKDGLGSNVPNGNATAQWSNLGWAGGAPVFTNSVAPDSNGGTATNGELTTGWLTSASNTFVSGVDTLVVYMPMTAGTYTLTGRTSGATANSTLLTFTVVDPVQDAQTAAIAAAQKAAVAQAAAAQAAADAATDAALQAIDAANAATDAANLAAEAADAATVAAQEAKDAADAATAAVESLATQVATLMAALQAQITSLANVVAKIAKKVKA